MSVQQMRQVLFVSCLLVLMLTSAGLAQQHSDANLLKVARELIKTQTVEIKSKNAVIDSKNLDIANLRTQISERDKLTGELKAKNAEQEKLIASHKQVLELMMNGLVKAHKEQIAIFKETVEERDKVISQLAQPRKTPVWQKVAESVVPVASIIAIAAAGGN